MRGGRNSLGTPGNPILFSDLGRDEDETLDYDRYTESRTSGARDIESLATSSCDRRHNGKPMPRIKK